MRLGKKYRAGSSSGRNQLPIHRLDQFNHKDQRIKAINDGFLKHTALGVTRKLQFIPSVHELFFFS